MEFKRNQVIALHLAGQSQADIIKELNVNKMFVYRTINRYKTTGSVNKRYGGGPKKTATTPEMIEKVKTRIQQNPWTSGNQMAKELNISQSSIRRIFKSKLMVKSDECEKAHDLTPQHDVKISCTEYEKDSKCTNEERDERCKCQGHAKTKTQKDRKLGTTKNVVSKHQKSFK